MNSNTDRTKKGLNDPFAKRNLNNTALNSANQKQNMNSKQKINMLNSRQKLAEQLLTNEIDFDNTKNIESKIESKDPPKFKRPGMKNENENMNNENKKSKVNLDDLLENYEKHELPEAELHKISGSCESQNINNFQGSNNNKSVEENRNLHNQNDENLKNSRKEDEKEGLILNNSNNNQEKNQRHLDEFKDSKIILNNKPNNNKSQDENTDLHEIDNNNKNNMFNEENDTCINNKKHFDFENEEDYSGSLINLHPQENTFDEIKNKNTLNKNNINNIKFKEIGSSISINPKNTILEEHIGSSNNLFESSTTQNQNFFENLTGNSNKNSNFYNTSNNADNISSNLNLGSNKTIENQNILLTNTNSEKDIISNSKDLDNIDFNLNNNNENKSSNTNSDNNHANSNEDNLSIPEINCKSIELTNENINEKKHSSNSSNLNNQSNGNFQETKDYNDDANNVFISNFKEKNIITNKILNKEDHAKLKSNKNIIEITEDLNENKNNSSDENKNLENKDTEDKENINNNNIYKHSLNFLENEIKNLRTIINNYKIKEIEEDESMLKLEISSLKNTLKTKNLENDLLANENKNLKEHIQLLQENLQKFFTENKYELNKTSINQIPEIDQLKNKQENEDDSKKRDLEKTKNNSDNLVVPIKEKQKISKIDHPESKNSDNLQSNVSSNIFNSLTTQSSLETSEIKNIIKHEELSSKKKSAAIRNNPPPPFKMNNKNIINFTDPNALFESSTTNSIGKSSGLFD